MAQFPFCEATVTDIHAALIRGDLSAKSLVEGYLARIDAYDCSGPKLNSIITVNPHALEQAQALDMQMAKSGQLSGLLHGIPVLVKDQAETAGILTSFGSEVMAEYLPEEDAEVIRRLRAAGAIILAKTTMPDFATAWFSFSSRSTITRNPYDTACDPGGSSSGTGAAVAANLGAIGLGEDTGGSIRLPASFNNLVGLKVTPGLISRRGLSPLVGFQDSAGPMCRTVSDAARMMDVLAGFDAADMATVTAVIAGKKNYLAGLRTDALEGRRIGILRQAFGDQHDPRAAAVNEVMEEAISAIARCGGEAIDFAVPDLDYYVEYTSLYITHSRHDIDQFLADRPALKHLNIADILASKRYDARLDLLEAIGTGPEDPFTEADYYQRYIARETFQKLILKGMAENGLDAFVFPTTQIAAPRHDELAANEWTTLSFPTNTLIAAQSWLPAVSVPAGFTTNGLPVGMEWVGLPYGEDGLLSYAYAFEQATQWRRAPACAPELHAAP
ncbi:MAG: amidase [Pseudomonadota bacterium]